jgi:hypothetical protein
MQRQIEIVVFCVLTVFATAATATLSAQAPPSKPKLKRLPPQGIDIDQADRSKLLARITAVQKRVDDAASASPDPLAWRSHVDVLVRAVRLALEQRLFYKPNQVDAAHRLLDEAERRIVAAADGQRGLRLLGFRESENEAPQPLVAGFVSRIDDSVQPFGIVVPAGYTLEQRDTPHRMDVWLHGRGDTKTEIPFLIERMDKAGLYTPEDTFVLHPFGRHCNAFKFAGETDVYEAIDHAGGLFSVDPQRVSIRGFSMGGAGCWHLAVHDPTRWLAANPGAGFVDTIVYQGWSNGTPFPLTPTQTTLLRWYDVLPWTINLKNTRTIAYSGEVDKQKQAADRVVERAGQLGIEFPYVIGKGMGHKVDDASKQVIDAQINQWADEVQPSPRDRIHFVTYTLRYATADWIRVTGMRQHWTAAEVKASLDRRRETITIDTRGVTHLDVDFSQSGWPQRRGDVDITIDGETFSVADTGNRKGFQCSLVKDDQGNWTSRVGRSDVVRKRPGLQGPIDDAFCDRFVIVMPSRPARHGQVQRWIDREVAYLRSRWARLMRGDVPIVTDRELTADQIETCHLICFGDFSSNGYLAKIAARLPIGWTREELTVGEWSFDPVSHTPAFVYPNPLNPERYVVVNSGLTFREFSNTSNSRQIAMLPDWAVLDVTAADDSIYAGEIKAQGFFDESWQLKQGGSE